MTETVFFCLIIFAVLFVGIYGIITAQKNKSVGLTKENTDSTRGIAICMIAASHIAQFTSGGGVAHNFVFLWGGMGVAVFFMLSGYGNYFSIQKATSRVQWLIKRIIQILVPFVFCFIYVTIVQIFIFRCPASWDYFRNFVSLSIPGTSTWYFKIQILLYAFLMLSVIICRDKSHYILCVLVLLYISIAYGIKMDNYWYMTSLCFPLGYIIGKYKEKVFNGQKALPFFIISGCLFIIAFIGYRTFGGEVLQIIYFLLLTIVVVAFLSCFGLLLKTLSAVGKHSIYVYLIHIGIVRPCYAQISNIWAATGAYVLLIVLGTVICSRLSEPLNKCILQRLIKKENQQ